MSADDLLVIGLGNPGSQYQGTRHNVGAEAVERLAQRVGVRLGRFSGPATAGTGTWEGHSLILARPTTYMNESGVAGAKLVRHFNLPLTRVVVVYDDLDLPVGRLRLRAAGSTGGHNGLKSLQAHWRSQSFPRVRIGIGRPPPDQDPIQYVLGRPRGQERDRLAEASSRAVDAVLAIASLGLDEAMTQFNRDLPAGSDAGASDAG